MRRALAKHSPGAATLGHVEEGVEYLCALVLGGTSTTLGLGHQVLNLLPLFIFEVRRVWLTLLLILCLCFHTCYYRQSVPF